MRIALISSVVLVLAAACGDDDSSASKSDAGVAAGHSGSGGASGHAGSTAGASGHAGSAGASGHAGAAAGASGSTDDTDAGPVDCSATVSLVDYKLSPSSLSLTAGSNTLCASNDGKAPHDLAIRDADGTKLGITATLKPGETGHFTVDLKAGDYTMYCSQAGHESLGMKGPVTVK